MTLSDISIKNPVFSWMLMLGLILFGWIGFLRMGVSQMPDVDFPVLNISLTLEGAAPEVMETDVVDVVEDALMGVQGLKEISSSSRQGSANVTAEFELGRDVDVALQEVQAKLAQVQRVLPRDMDPPVVSKVNPEDQPIMWLALSGNRPRKEMIEYVKNQLKDEFVTVPGVGEIFLGGYIEPNLRVWLDAAKMHRFELSVDDVISAIESQHAEVPAGRIEADKRELNVRVLGEAASVEEFSNLIIPRRSGSPIWKTIRLKDVATVEEGLADVRRLSRVMGRTAVGLGIKKQRGSNAVAVAHAVKKRMEELKKSLPSDLDLGINFDSTQFIEDSVGELYFTLILSALLTSLVCWAFLGSWSSTFNILMAIPTSIIGTFIVLYFLGFTLNTFTLLALSLVIGIVVDDAIMVLENIARYREQGLSRVQGALVGAREITFAAIAASVAILAIFLPVAFMRGIIGKFFFQFGVTISVAVMFSLLEALTLAPMRSSQFLEVGHTGRVGKVVDRFFRVLGRRYHETLALALRHRWKVVAGSTLFFIGSLFVTKFLKKEFVPSQDQSMFLVRLQTPVGSSLEYTDSVFKQAETITMGHPEVKRYFGAIGGFGGGEVNTGVLFVTMKEPRERPRDPKSGKKLSQQDFMKVIRQEFNRIPGILRASVQDLSLAGFTSRRGFPVEFTVKGPNWEKLGELDETFRKRMEMSGLMIDVDSNYQLGMPEVKVFPDRTQAALRGVNIASIGNTINAMIGGVRVGKYTRDGKRSDIRLRLVSEDRKKPGDISRIWVRNQHGELVQLSDVVRLEEKPTLLSIQRINRERAISLFANVAPGKSQAEAIAAVQKVAKEVLPEGYHIVLSGSAETYKESFQSLIFALWLGVVVAYMVLASQFNSFLHPFTVLLALPFSVSGAFLALWMSGISLNMYSMIGVILLMGIVKKNSILLVDFTNERRKQGLGVSEALLEACPIRLRPILMTSISTIAAAVPPALALGPGAEVRIPMAVTVIGGMVVSTLLTLYVVPCAYSLLSHVESRKHRERVQEALRELGELPAAASSGERN